MAPQQDKPEELYAKISVFVTSIIIGTVVAGVLNDLLGVPTLFSVLGGIVVAFLNPLVAAAFASVCESLHQSAFPDSYSSWSTASKALHGAFWPVTTTYWLVVFLFFFTINRLFRSTAPPEEHSEPAKPQGPPFLIEVARCQPARDVRLKDLTITHPGCGGGKFEPGRSDNYLNCPRCHVQFSIEPGEHSIGAICQTSFDGKPREVVAYGVPKEYSGVLVQAKKEL